MHGKIKWEATYPSYLKKLKSLQNRAIRSVVGGHFRDSVNPYYSQLKILQIDHLFKFKIAQFVYGSLNNKTPYTFRKYFCKTSDPSSQATRQSTDCSNLYAPSYRTIKLQRCIKYQEVKIWNCIPQIFGHFRTKNLNLATKTFYYLCTNISIKEFVYAVCKFLS